MAAFRITTIFLLSFLSKSAYCDKMSRDSLDKKYGPVVYVSVLYRHGDQTPEKMEPNDLYQDSRYWPEGLGELTQKGLMNIYKNGKWLAGRYKHLIPKNWMDINKKIRAVSTDWSKTIMSAQALLQGMFPTSSDGQWGGIKTFPVPVHILQNEADALLEVTKKCDKLDYLMEQAFQTPRYKDIMRIYGNVIEYLERHGGYKVDKIFDVEPFYESYQIEIDRGLKLDDWRYLVYPWPMSDIITAAYILPTSTDNLKRLRAGPFLKEVINNFNDSLSGKSERTISLYTGHDTTVVAVMNTLGIYDWVPTEFGGTLMMELRKPRKGEPLVTMVYTNMTHVTRILRNENCDEACPLSRFETIFKPFIPDDWENECDEVPSATTEKVDELTWSK